MRPVVILAHKNDMFDHVPYLIVEMARIWRDQGLPVYVLQRPERCPENALAVLHVNLTVIPDVYMTFIRRFPVVINGAVSDISKRLVSSNIVYPGDNYDGKVIIKTNLNFGGNPEARCVSKGSFARRYANKLRNKMPWTFRSRLSATGYKIFDSVKHVPLAVWFNPDLVVERFLPEIRHGYYCLRSWIFLGNKEFNILGYSHSPIVKSMNIVHREIVAEVPEELRRIRKKLGFDFGKFDYAIVDGKVVLYDANRTPTMGRMAEVSGRSPAAILADGIWEYFVRIPEFEHSETL